MTSKIERRAFAISELEVRDQGDEPPMIRGYAAIFDTLSDDLGGFREKIDPGAFNSSVGGDVRGLFNHDANFILGRTTSKTLRLNVDQRGLGVEIDPPDSPMTEHVLSAMRRGDVTQMSFGFRTLVDKWEMTEDGEVRTLMDLELYDVSPVVFPAYPDTQVAVRSLAGWRAEQEVRTPWRAALRRRRLDLFAPA